MKPPREPTRHRKSAVSRPVAAAPRLIASKRRRAGAAESALGSVYATRATSVTSPGCLARPAPSPAMPDTKAHPSQPRPGPPPPNVVRVLVFGRGPGPGLAPQVRPTATRAESGLSAELPVPRPRTYA